MQRLAWVAQGLYAGASPARRTLARLRPYICPFDLLLDLVPPRSRVLDIGCGSGLMLGLLAHHRRLARGVGIDADPGAIAAAQGMARRREVTGARLEFHCQDARQSWPDGPFDLISLVDVLHHVAPDQQLGLITRAAAAVPSGGWLLYKDMAARPRWRACANHLHDLALARQWIHHRGLSEVLERTAAAGLTLIRRGRAHRWWYAHEWALLHRDSR